MAEIDLHGLKPDEALDAFVKAYNRERDVLRVVHGYGSSGTGGVIRRRIRDFLDRHSDKLSWFAGEAIDGNPGYTLVQPRNPLPTTHDQLADAIVVYCGTPRTEEKIAGEFRQHPARQVKEAIRRLTREGRLQEILKAGRTAYLSSKA